MPSRYNAASFKSDTARATRMAEPTFAQLQIGSAFPTVIIPLEASPAKIKVITEELCETALETMPIIAAFHGLPMYFVSVSRKRRLVRDFRLLLRRLLPLTNRPSPTSSMPNDSSTLHS